MVSTNFIIFYVKIQSSFHFSLQNRSSYDHDSHEVIDLYVINFRASFGESTTKQ